MGERAWIQYEYVMHPSGLCGKILPIFFQLGNIWVIFFTMI
jgi:hypothetical protein